MHTESVVATHIPNGVVKDLDTIRAAASEIPEAQSSIIGAVIVGSATA